LDAALQDSARDNNDNNNNNNNTWDENEPY